MNKMSKNKIKITKTYYKYQLKVQLIEIIIVRNKNKITTNFNLRMV